MNRPGTFRLRLNAVVVIAGCAAVMAAMTSPAFAYYSTSSIWYTTTTVYGRSETYIEPNEQWAGQVLNQAQVLSVLTRPDGNTLSGFVCDFPVASHMDQWTR